VRVPWQVKFGALALIWGGSFLLMKIGLQALEPVQISTLRIASGAATVLLTALVMGVRLPLLGHAIHRRPVRGWLGAEFARIVSLAFGQRLQDTQCGAKLSRVTPETIAAFSQPFASRWIFDVELLARLGQLWRNSGNSLRANVYECPLDQWEDVAGSKLKRGDFFKAFAELAVIWWRYLRPSAPQFVGTAMPGEIGYDAPGTSTRRAA